MSVIKYLETNFNNQSIRTKIELILFPLIITLIIIFFTNESKNLESVNDIKIKINDTFNQINMENKILDILNDLESFLKTNKMQLNKISNNKNSIKIEIEANLIKQLLFIKFIEDYNSFSKIKYLRQEADILIVEIIFDKVYLKKSFELKKSFTNIEDNSITKFNLFAIVDDKVLINNKWLKIKDSINSFKIIDIKENSVYLNNGFRTIKLKINKNEDN